MLRKLKHDEFVDGQADGTLFQTDPLPDFLRLENARRKDRTTHTEAAERLP